MNRIQLPLLLIGITLVACSPKIRSNLANTTFPPLESKDKIIILDESEKVPENSVLVGDLKIGDSGFSTDCGYTTVIENAKETAKKSGANIIKLTEVKKPNFGSSCYRIKAKLYRNSGREAMATLTSERTLKNKSRLPEDADYAIIYFYRPKSFQGSAIGYKVRLDDETEIGRVRNGEKFEYKTKDFGKHKFWGKTESQDSVVIDIQKGQEYFVRCGMKMGIGVGKPEMYLIENHVGIKEYEKIE
ncbi:DUF2846 domain-containing protein [Sinomicrobium weinanense]|uniref:DUF2846 domain-containing protein n=1 Tax=Sinomicrobium weinanense TaxID=2842200 RepID=A0A926JPZ1_9FLAO|nr:DUF2846 domain-containing protein [Sinomicrobium weinanense]MBC9795111.1 DUF2846 domain-containing protein [Sinomicrobium weinanense]MBU3123758.1 DUF2846 domain-containing protein [Sinomicrobium weinanense]